MTTWIGRLRLLLCINLFIFFVQLILALSNGSWNQLAPGVLVSLLYGNLTAVPSILILPGVFERLALRKFPLLPLVVAYPLAFILAGCLAAQALLWWTGVLRLQHFWLYYLRTLPFVLVAGLIFGLGAFIYGSMQQRLQEAERRLHEKAVLEERAQKLAVEARLGSLESRLHPHFLFNALNSVSALIVEDPVLAEQTVGRIAALLRSSLNHSNQSLIPLYQEAAMIEDYFGIETVRFGDRLRARVEIPIELQNASVPHLSILSLVENALKHSITAQPTGGECLVTASVDESAGNLIVEVCDTGPGFHLDAIPTGHGLDNLIERLKALFGDRAALEVLRQDGWCVVQMRMPLS